MNTSQPLSCLGPGIPLVIINVAIIIMVIIMIEYQYAKSMICLRFHDTITIWLTSGALYIYHALQVIRWPIFCFRSAHNATACPSVTKFTQDCYFSINAAMCVCVDAKNEILADQTFQCCTQLQWFQKGFFLLWVWVLGQHNPHGIVGDWE